MPRTAQRRVTVTGDDGVTRTFNPGEDVPDELVERIDNDLVWESIEDRPTEAQGNVTNEADVPLGVSDAPYATPPEGDGVVTPQGGPTPETIAGTMPEQSEAGESSPTSEDQLRRMSRSDLDNEARNRGLDPSGARNREEVISMITSGEGDAEGAE